MTQSPSQSQPLQRLKHLKAGLRTQLSSCPARRIRFPPQQACGETLLRQKKMARRPRATPKRLKLSSPRLSRHKNHAKVWCSAPMTIHAKAWSLALTTLYLLNRRKPWSLLTLSRRKQLSWLAREQELIIQLILGYPLRIVTWSSRIKCPNSSQSKLTPPKSTNLKITLDQRKELFSDSQAPRSTTLKLRRLTNISTKSTQTIWCKYIDMVDNLYLQLSFPFFFESQGWN